MAEATSTKEPVDDWEDEGDDPAPLAAGGHPAVADIADDDEETAAVPESVAGTIAHLEKNGLNYELVAAVVAHICATQANRGAILIFLPGLAEIKRSVDWLN